MPRVPYFAYGSNMDPGTFSGRRGIAWTEAVVARAPGWRLAVDKPSLLGNGEGMATILQDDADEVWGVLYEISAEDLEHIEFTEGVLIGHYRRVEIDVECVAQAERVRAVTLASEERVEGLRPTFRYLNLLLAGAEAHGLPSGWIARLRAIEGREESPEAASLRPYFDRAMRKPE